MQKTGKILGIIVLGMAIFAVEGLVITAILGGVAVEGDIMVAGEIL